MPDLRGREGTIDGHKEEKRSSSRRVGTLKASYMTEGTLLPPGPGAAHAPKPRPPAAHCPASHPKGPHSSRNTPTHSHLRGGRSGRVDRPHGLGVHGCHRLCEIGAKLLARGRRAVGARRPVALRGRQVGS